MSEAKCKRCLGVGEGPTFEQAANNINHAVALSRGIPCGASYNRVVEINKKVVKIDKKVETKKTIKPKTDSIIVDE